MIVSPLLVVGAEVLWCVIVYLAMRWALYVPPDDERDSW